NVTGSDLDRAIFLSPDGQNTQFAFPDDVFSISIGSCDPQTDPNQCVISVSEPSTFALLAFGLFGIGLMRRRSIA
ncbi:PEP-CTERM sorting domain-containing protein, partial [Oleiphilus sp. HI0086]